MLRNTQVAIRVLLLAGVAAFRWPSAGWAETLDVDCDAGHRAQPVIDAAMPGDTIQVTGTCNEHLEFRAEASRVTLDGHGAATISGPNATIPTITITGRAITLTGLRVTGGENGILVASGGQAVISGNTIEETGDDGVGVLEASSALIQNNTIQSNPDAGVILVRTSFARISSNAIRNNGRRGISVVHTSSARIFGNTITENGGHGIEVTRVSQAEVSGNSIEANRGHGVYVVGGSGANLGSDRGEAITTLPNSTIAPNGGFGILCQLGGYADGRLGTLNGEAGAADFSEGCIDSLIR